MYHSNVFPHTCNKALTTINPSTKAGLQRKQNLYGKEFIDS